ncbi:hypothetical protein [Micromonospora sp. HK10]|uniref:hypothetical protein n=1 Tax=Micromonospora sp. HK10 TaxID=1538294 RepID=UPI000AB3AEFC|nr:hypothetical protein [Micromonospora sp. HK10]
MPTEPLRCAGALIVDDDGRSFIQRRSPDRRILTDCRDIVEHRDVDEDGFAALRPIGR